MLAVVGGERAIPYLRSLAVLPGVENVLIAADAVATLAADAVGDGYSTSPRAQQLASLAVLRELFEKRLVTQHVAAVQLEFFAESQGWRRERDCP
jgi:hypothetical protein